MSNDPQIQRALKLLSEVRENNWSTPKEQDEMRKKLDEATDILKKFV